MVDVKSCWYCESELCPECGQCHCCTTPDLFEDDDE